MHQMLCILFFGEGSGLPWPGQPGKGESFQKGPKHDAESVAKKQLSFSRVAQNRGVYMRETVFGQCAP